MAHRQPFCPICKNSGKSPSVYTSHFVRDKPGPNCIVVCPTLLNTQCRFCHKLGHTPKYCPILKSRKPSPQIPIIDKDGFTKVPTKRSSKRPNRHPHKPAPHKDPFTTKPSPHKPASKPVNVFAALAASQDSERTRILSHRSAFPCIGKANLDYDSDEDISITPSVSLHGWSAVAALKKPTPLQLLLASKKASKPPPIHIPTSFPHQHPTRRHIPPSSTPLRKPPSSTPLQKPPSSPAYHPSSPHLVPSLHPMPIPKPNPSPKSLVIDETVRYYSDEDSEDHSDIDEDYDQDLDEWSDGENELYDIYH